MANEIIMVCTAYLLGSIPTGLLLARAAGVDIRSAGSGNIGATNVYRTMGRGLGIATLVGDCLKGLIPVLVARHMDFSLGAVAAVGLAAFLGHVYNIFLGFKGGKGVATALGVFIGTSWPAVLLALAVFLLILRQWRYVSLASIAAAAAIPLLVTLIEQKAFLTLMSIIIATIVIQKHRDNIARLKAGTENRFKG